MELRPSSSSSSSSSSPWSPRAVVFLPLLGAFFLAGQSYCRSSSAGGGAFVAFEQRHLFDLIADSPLSSTAAASTLSTPSSSTSSSTFSSSVSTTDESPQEKEQTDDPSKSWNVDLNRNAVQWILNSTDTRKLAQVPYQQLERFLDSTEGRDTPAARFVTLLRQELHGHPNWEPRRVRACRSKQLAVCIGGFHNVAKTNKKEDSLTETEAYLPLLPQSADTTVHRVRRYRDSDNIIANLGSNMACLPLFLAGASIDVRTGMVVEMGPFAGFSSKCLAYGVVAAFLRAEQQGLVEKDALTTTPPRLVSLDTFEGIANYKAIAGGRPWISEAFPEYSANNTNFLKLWEDTVQYVYPKATGHAGFIHAKSLNNTKLEHDFGVSAPHTLMADSIKNPSSFHGQLEGLTVKSGTVLILMDFLQSGAQIQQVYGCLRKEYLLPVYVSWRTEHMAFVVTKTFSINDQSDIYQCYVKMTANWSQWTDVMKARIKQDLTFLSGLTVDPVVHQLYNPDLLDHMAKAMMENIAQESAKGSKTMAKYGREYMARHTIS